MYRPSTRKVKRQYRNGKPLCLVPTCKEVCEQYKNGKYKNYCKNHNYSDMWEFTRWSELREVILARDKKCAICGHTGDYFNPLQVDHIIEVSRGGSMWDKNNLQVLCSNCHKIKTAKYNAKRKLKQDIAKGVQKTL